MATALAGQQQEKWNRSFRPEAPDRWHQATDHLEEQLTLWARTGIMSHRISPKVCPLMVSMEHLLLPPSSPSSTLCSGPGQGTLICTKKALHIVELKPEPLVQLPRTQHPTPGGAHAHKGQLGNWKPQVTELGSSHEQLKHAGAPARKKIREAPTSREKEGPPLLFTRVWVLPRENLLQLPGAGCRLPPATPASGRLFAERRAARPAALSSWL
ncbi:hypothetical protein H920_18028 [Fukomys damarensis]|uniref:Uncharacterized protein n=1 Tax=Fukomys damarensis TaxID=885580 RepID=A0A091CRW0_FUKDA|nr:hypothetical protein H920_18028 [Fukomys damarensis]